MSASKPLNDILTAKHVDCIVKKATGEECYELMSEELRPASEGILGYLGEHYRLALRLRLPAGERTLRLFLKTLPLTNHDKRDFIVSANFFRREELMFRLFEDIGGDDGPNPWHPKAFLCTESFVVMPDLSFEGYSSRPLWEYCDLPHALATATSMARFHAGYANYDTAKTSNGNHYSFFQKYKDLLQEPSFGDSPWLRAAANLSSSLIKTYSKYKDIPNLEEKMTELFINACKTFHEHNETFNLVIHRDLWCNNILFRYENNVPVNAILIDFQCFQYGPPAYDITIFLYLQTSKKFREAHEKEICMHYFKIFLDNVDEATRKRLEKLGYSLGELLSWLQRARMYGMVVAMSILPYVLMDPLTARRVYDDPETFDKLMTQERCQPVLEYCLQNTHFRDRQVEVAEEFIERYILNVL